VPERDERVHAAPGDAVDQLLQELAHAWRRAAGIAPAARLALFASGVDGAVEDLLATLDLEHDERLGGVAIRVERDGAGDAGVVLRGGDQVAQLLRGGL